jgi:RNA polymerase sigma factor (sigma-70 family)
VTSLLSLPRLGAAVGARTHDQDFAECYPGLFRCAMRLAHRLTRDPALAEDLAAEAMARAYARWGQVRQARSPEAWVQRVTANLVIDHARHSRVAADALPLLGTDDVLMIDDHVTLRLALVAALATLPRKQREAVVLRFIAGLEEPDLSAALSASPSTVRTHIQRGLAALRERLPAFEEVNAGEA